MAKLLAESLHEYRELNNVMNESELHELNEGLFSNPVKLWGKIDKANIEQVKKFAKGLVTGATVDAKERTKKNIDNDAVTLELLVPALEQGAQKQFKDMSLRVGKQNGQVVVKMVPVTMAASTAPIKRTGSA